MRYFYVNAQNQAVGPVDRTALEELRRANAIGDGCRVSLEGDTVWRTYGELFSPPSAGFEPPPLPRPVSVMVFGICNLFFGGLGVLCIPITAVGAIVGAVGGSFSGHSPLFSGWQIFSSVMSFFIRGAMLASGFGLVRYREWGRKLGVVSAAAEMALVLGTIGMLFHNPLLEGLGEGQEGLMRLFMFIQLLVGLAYPLAMLIVLTRSSIRAALQDPA